jgi:hypothetical protein
MKIDIETFKEFLQKARDAKEAEKETFKPVVVQPVMPSGNKNEI